MDDQLPSQGARVRAEESPRDEPGHSKPRQRVRSSTTCRMKGGYSLEGSAVLEVGAALRRVQRAEKEKHLPPGQEKEAYEELASGVLQDTAWTMRRLECKRSELAKAQGRTRREKENLLEQRT